MYTSPRVSRPGAFCVWGVKMFASLSDRFSKIISSIKGNAIITEDDLNNTLREIRVALLEADVALDVVKKFISSIREKTIGENVLKNIKPDQMIIKIVYDELVNILGSTDEGVSLSSTPPAVILFCGLQGSGKTTSASKLAKHLQVEQNKKILLTSTDIYRPAAQEQLKTLAETNDINFFNITESQDVSEITLESLRLAKKELYDVLIIDTA